MFSSIRGLHAQLLEHFHIIPPALLSHLIPHTHLIQALDDNIASLEWPAVVWVVCAVTALANAVVHVLWEIVSFAGLALPRDIVWGKLCVFIHPFVDWPELANEFEGFFNVVGKPELVFDMARSLVLKSINKYITPNISYHVKLRRERHLMRRRLIRCHEFR